MFRSDIKIYVADDHPVMRQGLTKELKELGYTLLGEGETGAKAYEDVVQLQPTVALLDIEMPLMDGLEVVKRAKPLCPNTLFILITYHKQNHYAIRAKQLNVAGFLLKDDSIAEIDRCIQAVTQGNIFFSSSFPKAVDEIYHEEMAKLQLLTPSERTILRHIANRQESARIAETLGISLRTVQKHRSNIITKLQLDSTADSLNKWTEDHYALLDEF